jgi:regulatory protein YycI of two-component signal transduction system YycFG
MIFNLDRFIVSSTGKGDGTDSITWKEFGQAIPRIIIALILGLTISKPLEIKILETEINVELRKKQQEKLAEFNESTTKRFQADIDRIDADLAKIETDRIALVERQKAAEQEYIDQMQGRSGMAGYGPRAKHLEALKDEKTKQVAEFDERTRTQVNNLEKQRQKKLDELDHELNVTNLEQAHNLDGLLARMETSHDLSPLMGFILTLVFLSIEMGPIFFKMMMTKGAYDYMVENFNLKQNIENGIIREEHLYEGKNGALLMEKYRYLHVEAIQKEKEDALEAQKDLTGKIIGSWKNAKLKELDETPANFYKTLDL